MNSLFRSLVSLLFSFALLIPASAAESSGKTSDMVILDETGVQNLKIETLEVEESTFEETVFALGRIEVLPGKKAIVSSRIPGRAFSVLVIPNQQVSEGDEIMWVESRQPGDPPPTVKLTAPMTGHVAKVDVVVGQPVEPDKELMEIVDLTQVEAAAQVPQNLAGRLANDLTAHIRIPAYPGKVFEAKLVHVGAYADATSGTIEAGFHVNNRDFLLRPGMRAEFSIVLNRREGVMSVPRAALQGEASQRFVYVRDFDLKNAFIKTPVVTGEINDQSVEILKGLLPGDEVVIRGAYSLAFAGGGSLSLKDALDAAHGHEHNSDGSEKGEAGKSDGEKEEHGHDHEGSGTSWNMLTTFFAAASGLLLILLVLAMRRRQNPDQDTPSTADKEAP